MPGAEGAAFTADHPRPLLQFRPPRLEGALTPMRWGVVPRMEGGLVGAQSKPYLWVLSWSRVPPTFQAL